MPRRFGWIIGLSLLAVLRVEATPSVPAPQRSFTIRYLASIHGLPATAQHVHIWVPLATSRDGQQILHRSVHAPIAYDIFTESVYGNEMLHAMLTAPVPAQLEVQVTYDTLVQGGDRMSAEALAALPADVQTMYLRAERLTVIDDAVRRLAAAATRGHTTTVERARGIYDAVIRHMRYDKDTPGWGRGDVARACVVGRGNCTDFHALFIAMARASGIPARFKIGAEVPTDPAHPVTGYHCWAEFYRAGRGWVPVDASEAWKHPEAADRYFGAADANKFTVSTGRDLRLVPQQQGGPVNLFVKPYVEVDGRPFEDVDVRFQWLAAPTAEVSHGG